jgi:co-chaperonin GroES (HSP10)
MSLDVQKLRPLGGRILVQRIRPKAETRSGLIITPSMERNNRGESLGRVLRISEQAQVLERDGDEILLDPRDYVSVGDVVLHRGFLRHAVALGDEAGAETHDEFYLICVSDIIGTIEGSGIYGEYQEYEV